MAQDDDSILKRLKYKSKGHCRHKITYYNCPVCGKEFSLLMCSGWGWTIKAKGLKFCTYGCMRRAEKLLGIGQEKEKKKA